ncbi:fimbrial protein [Bacteroides reticulotermitis]|uniref:fimbrial protein n=1 Tax=Bacteroides reticulotermitis TaxID=1133319 RepID=UPI003A8B988F
MKIVKLKWIFLSLIVILGGCTNDDFIDPEGGIDRGTHMELLLTLNLPDAFTSPSTYALNATKENTIKDFDVLVFKKNKTTGVETFLYATTGTADIDGTGTPAQKIRVTLKKSSSSDEQHRVVVLANLRKAVEDATRRGHIVEGNLKGDVLSKITFGSVREWNVTEDNYTPLPMWGETAQCIAITASTNSTSLGTINLLRSVARIDVGLNINDKGETLGGLDNFKISQVKVCNSNNSGLAAPFAVSGNKVTLPSLPPSGTATGDMTYRLTPAGNGLIREIYTAESDNKRAAEGKETYLIIAGYYNESTNYTWYRIDFFEKGSDQSPEEVKLDLLRNHIYRVNITSVSGPGYQYEDDAKNSRPMNLKYSVQAWDSGDMSDIVFDGVNTLGVSDKKIVVTSAESTQTLKIRTDAPRNDDTGYNNTSIRVRYSIYEDRVSEGTAADKWIEQMSCIENEIDSTKGLMEYELKFKVLKNTKSSSRDRYIHIYANYGRMRLVVQVTQGIAPIVTITSDKYYAMDGGWHSFNVESNVPWKAVVVKTDESSVIENGIALADGGKLLAEGLATGAGGTDVKFFTKNDILINPKLWDKTVKIEIRDVDNKVIKPFELRCLSGAIQNKSNSYIVKTDAAERGIAIPVERANDIGTIQLGANEPYTAALLWTDNKSKIADSSNIKFVAATGIGRGGHVLVWPGSTEGNFAVSASNAAGNIIWSWHVWVTSFDPNEGTTSKNGFVFMKRNLGATTDPVEVGTRYAVGLIYQWGRKDPYLGSQFEGNFNATLMMYNGNLKRVGGQSTMANAIANPTHFYCQKDGDWCSEQRNDLWGAVKTVYDPCPEGWKVPALVGGTTSPWSHLTSVNVFTKGNNAYFSQTGEYYPPAGSFRDIPPTSTTIVYGGEEGHYWIASIANNNQAYNLYFNNRIATKLNTKALISRSSGCSIRCVKE